MQETLSPRYGGPATVLPQLARAQATAGHDVVVATTNADQPSGVYHQPGWDRLPGSEVRVYYAPVQFAPLTVSFGLCGYLLRAIRTFDVVHVHGLYRFPATIAAKICRWFGVPFVIRPHGSLDPYLYDRSTSGKLRLKRLYERWLDLPNLNAAAAVHYTAEEERERASFLALRGPSFVIPNGLDSEQYRELPARGDMRARWGLGDAPIVLFLGRLHVKKGLDLLIPAFDAVRKVRPDTHLVIAGPENDKYGETVREWVTERNLDAYVHFVGPLHGADVLRAYVDADVFALPSYTENFGMTVVEAMACALPVVISDQVNIHADISRASAGIVTRCDSDDVATALLALLGDANRRHAAGCAGRRLVRERYSWPVIVDALSEEYALLIERRRDSAAPPRTDARGRWRRSR